MEQLLLPGLEGNPLRTGKFHVSHSEFSVWSGCAFRHKLTYIDKLGGDDSNIYSIFGGIVHEGLETWLLNRGSVGFDLDALCLSLKRSFRVALLDLKDPPESGQVQKFEESLDTFWKVFPGWLEETFPGWRLTASEFPLYESIRLGTWFKGFIDLVLKTPDGTTWVLDLKTSIAGWSDYNRTSPVKVSQLVFYKHFFSQKLGLDPTRVKVGFVVFAGTPQDEERPMELIVPSEKLLEPGKHLADLRGMINIFQKGFTPKNRASCGFCPYANTEACPL